VCAEMSILNENKNIVSPQQILNDWAKVKGNSFMLLMFLKFVISVIGWNVD
jgi:cytosine/uracil/thiamine/allantoin permease